MHTLNFACTSLAYAPPRSLPLAGHWPVYWSTLCPGLLREVTSQVPLALTSILTLLTITETRNFFCANNAPSSVENKRTANDVPCLSICQLFSML